jgi:hypothetical protein
MIGNDEAVHTVLDRKENPDGCRGVQPPGFVLPRTDPERSGLPLTRRGREQTG